jgi:hypothetical protein
MMIAFLLMTVIVMGGGELDVNRAKEGEHDGLEQADEQLEQTWWRLCGRRGMVLIRHHWDSPETGEGERRAQ